MAFCRSLPLKVWTSPSLDTTVPKPAGLASTCAQGRGVAGVSRRRVSPSKRNGQVEAGGVGPGAMRRLRRSSARKAGSAGAGRPNSRAISFAASHSSAARPVSSSSSARALGAISTSTVRLAAGSKV